MNSPYSRIFVVALWFTCACAAPADPQLGAQAIADPTIPTPTPGASDAAEGGSTGAGPAHPPASGDPTPAPPTPAAPSDDVSEPVEDTSSPDETPTEDTTTPEPGPDDPEPPVDTPPDGPAPGPVVEPTDAVYVRITESMWWQGGFNGGLEIVNASDAPLTGWTVECTFDSFEIVHAWNAMFQNVEGVATFDAFDWNAGIEVGGLAQVGFTAEGVLKSKTVGACTLNDAPVAAVPVPMTDSKPGGGEPAPAEPPPVVPGVLTNQVGYLPAARKRATVRTESATPLAWTIENQAGNVVAQGSTVPFGLDEASQDLVHHIDFSTLQTVGDGYVIRVGEESSHPFQIGKAVYEEMRWAALSYFYHNRSGIPIEMPWAGHEDWARPAGHLSDVEVPCHPTLECDYVLDVTQGWYDAGDHGKYVVNGGISAWTLMNLWEWALHLGPGTAMFGDGAMAIPESSNQTPDLLDEIRWQMEFMLKMQVPAGQEKAGMAHHKMHDDAWTPLGLAPHEDPMIRYLYPPSTAATLNLAATAAQAGRLWKTVDPVFSARCILAAKQAWAAAEAFPEEYATQQFTGGGPYDDNDVSDERYWAAAELFVTTGEPEFLQAAKESVHFASVPIAMGTEGSAPLTWKMTAAAGTFSLATVPGNLPATDRAQARGAVIAAADAFVALQSAEGYGTPYKALDGYAWGSNSFILNEMLAMALAYEFTGEKKYFYGVAESMDYLLGRNPMGQSYVTGYGESPLKYPHHRFWAYQADITYPKAPPGAISGGPNSGLQDPWVQQLQMNGCPPAKCFVDHIESWSTNEITINWNAPFAWVTAWLDEVGPQQ